MARPARVWFRNFDQNWYITLNGKKVNLFVKGKDNEAAAWQAYYRLISGQDTLPVTRQSVTLQQVVDAFLAYSKERVGQKTRVRYEQYLKNFAQKHGTLLPHQVNGPFVESYSRAPFNPTARKPKWGESTRGTFLAAVKLAFRHAERAGLIEKTPLQHLKCPPVPKRTADVLLTEDEFQKLYKESSKFFQPILKFIWLTGTRPSEPAQLTAADINWEMGTVTVREHKTKRHGHIRMLCPVPEAMAILKELAEKHPTGLLFRTRTSKRWSTVSLDGAFATARKRTGLTGKVLYSARHTYITDGLASGVSGEMVAALAGHSPHTLNQHYNHLASQIKVLKEAANRIR